MNNIINSYYTYYTGDITNQPFDKNLKLTIQYADNIMGQYSFYFDYNDDNSIFAKCRKKLNLLPLWCYDYVVMDEIHYIIQDSTFNFRVYDMFEMLMKINHFRTAMIFLSGTIEGVEAVLEWTINWKYYNNITEYKYSIKKYEVKTDYSYITPHTFATHSELLNMIADSGNDKWLIFVEAKDRGKKLCQQINDMYVSSGYEQAADFIYSKDHEGSKRKGIINNNKFEHIKCLISTSVLDNGVSIIDPDLKHIAIITYDDIEFIQMIGRKLITENDKELHVYVMECDSNSIEKYYEKIVDKIKLILRFGKLATNFLGQNATDYDKFSLIAEYCNSLRKYNEINGLVRFTCNGFKINILALYKYLLLGYQYINLIRKSIKISTHQFNLLGIHRPVADDPHLSSLGNILNQYMGYEFNNDTLQELKRKLNEVIKIINNYSIFPMKKVNDTSNTSITNRWLLGADIQYEIRSEIAEKKNSTMKYYVVILTEDEAHKKIIEYAGGLDELKKYMINTFRQTHN